MDLLMMCSLFLYQYTTLALNEEVCEYFTIKLKFSFKMILTIEEKSSFSKETKLYQWFISQDQPKYPVMFYTIFLNNF